MVISPEYYETQKQMFEALKKEQNELIKFEIEEITKLEEAEPTENRLKAIRTRKQRIEKFYQLLEMYEDVNHFMSEAYNHAHKEMEFLRQANTIYLNDVEEWIKIYKKRLHEKN